jgi:hypothetical protein
MVQVNYCNHFLNTLLLYTYNAFVQEFGCEATFIIMSGPLTYKMHGVTGFGLAVIHVQGDTMNKPHKGI